MADRSDEFMGDTPAGALLPRLAKGPLKSPPTPLHHRADFTVEEFTPMPRNLEAKLCALAWQQDGVQPFVSREVPFEVNCSGTASWNAAKVLIANCLERPPAPGPIELLELGAGSGLFARYLLDALRDLCQQQGLDFYRRVRFHVTDGSPRTVEHWQSIGLFAPHAERVCLQVCDAQQPRQATPGPCRAVYANYVLDSLPTRFLRRGTEGWEMLYARTWLRGDVDLRGYLPTPDGKGLSPQAIQQAAVEEPERLLPLLPALETELRFQPMPPSKAPAHLPLLELLADHMAGKAFPDCHGAIEAIQQIAPLLGPGGYLSVRDYGPSTLEASRGLWGGTRFGKAVASELLFPLLEDVASSSGLRVVDAAEPDCTIQLRLFTRESLPETGKQFRTLSGTSEQQFRQRLDEVRDAIESGSVTHAHALLQQTILECPENWLVKEEAGRILLEDLHHPAAAFPILLAAVQHNPWYRPGIWNLLGECLAALGQSTDSHACHLHAASIAPESAVAQQKLAGSYLEAGLPRDALAAVARGLAGDRGSQHKQDLLALQAQALEMLEAQRLQQRETAYRRGRQCAAGTPDT